MINLDIPTIRKAGTFLIRSSFSCVEKFQKAVTMSGGIENTIKKSKDDCLNTGDRTSADTQQDAVIYGPAHDRRVNTLYDFDRNAHCNCDSDTLRRKDFSDRTPAILSATSWIISTFRMKATSAASAQRKCLRKWSTC